MPAQQIFDSDLKGAWHYNHVTFTPIAKNFMLYCRLIYMLSILCVRLTIKVKMGIPESFKVRWYPPKKLGRVTLKHSVACQQAFGWAYPFSFPFLAIFFPKQRPCSQAKHSVDFLSLLVLIYPRKGEVEAETNRSLEPWIHNGMQRSAKQSKQSWVT